LRHLQSSVGVPLLAGVSRGQGARAGATLGNQYTLAGVNRAWQGIWPEQGRGCSTIIAARCLYWSIFFGMEEKNRNLPLHISGIKKGSKTDETDDSTLILTTLLLTSACRFKSIAGANRQLQQHFSTPGNNTKRCHLTEF